MKKWQFWFLMAVLMVIGNLIREGLGAHYWQLIAIWAAVGLIALAGLYYSVRGE